MDDCQRGTKENREVFEMWCYRRMLKISFIYMVTNEEVLERMSERRTLWKGEINV